MKKILMLILIIVFILGLMTAVIIFYPNSVDAPKHSQTWPLTERGSDNLRLFSPQPGDEITNPLLVIGEARGNWYFEASFPVILTDWDGLIIAEGIAQAQGDWMTTDFVPFSATLNFTKPGYGTTGSLILKKDNPSDLPEFDDAVEITIKFK
jgi:hypothetical protein